MLWVLWPISSISRVHSVRKHSSAQRMAGVRMPEKSENGQIKWYRTYFCNFLLLFLLVRFITATHFLNQQPESDLCLPMHLLHLIISKLSDVWCDTLKPVFKLKCPCWNYCIQTVRPNLTSVCTSSWRHSLSLPLSSRFHHHASVKARLWSHAARQIAGKLQELKFRRLACTSPNAWSACGDALCWNPL